jgi:hypothetical protein
MADFYGLIVPVKVRWVNEDVVEIGTAVNLLAPSFGNRPFPCNVVSIGGKDDEDVGLGFEFITVSPFPTGTEFELILIQRAHVAHGGVSNQMVVAIGQTQ